MKTALLHYWLLSMRGGEKVLEAIAQHFPEAPIYTHACKRSALSPALAQHPIHETFIARLPGAHKSCQKYLPLMPTALQRLDLSNYDLLISSESGPAKGIRKPSHTKHLCYCHTPMRYLWDCYDEYYRRAGLGAKLAMRLFTPPLRRFDLRSAENVDAFIANSHFVAERIKRIYQREAEVIYPPVEVERFQRAPQQERTYWLWLGALVPYKAPDVLIEAFRGLNETLVVAGTGPLLDSLRKTAPTNVTFLGHVPDEQLPSLYARAKGLLFPGIEDFGIVPVEAQAAGTPVLALRGGGALETVREGETGIFFDQATPQSLREAIEAANATSWNRERLQENARRFAPEIFHQAFMQQVDLLLRQHQ